MSRAYAKPLRGGGSRIIPRSSRGRFTRAVLDVKVCSECRHFILPEMKDTGTEAFPMLKKVWPETCHHCGAEVPR